MENRPDDSLQFDQAEYQKDTQRSTRTCAACGGVLDKRYFVANGHVVCETCAAKVKTLAASGGRLGRASRATALGLLAGAAGAGLYFAILSLTGYEFGLVAIVVGFLVGAAVRYGSGRRGGWSYQLLAILITYAAIVFTYVPYIVQGFNEAAPQQTELGQDPAAIAKVTVLRDQSVLLNGATVSMESLDAELKRVSDAGGQGWYHREGMASEPPGTAADEVAELFTRYGLDLVTYKDAQFREPETWSDQVSRGSTGQKLLVGAFLFGLAAVAPFLSLPENIIGLFIIGIALFEAWKLNKRSAVDLKGPFEISELPTP